jgi:hypothetical protein
MRLVSQADCRSAEMGSIPIRSAHSTRAMMAVRIPNPKDSVRFAGVLRARAEDGRSALQADRLGALPSGSTSGFDALLAQRGERSPGTRETPVRIRQGAPRGALRRRTLRALGVSGSTAGFQPAGDGSSPSARTIVSCGQSVLVARLVANEKERVRFSLAALLTRFSGEVHRLQTDERRFDSVARLRWASTEDSAWSSKPRWAGSIPAGRARCLVLLAAQATRFSPEERGFESRTRRRSFCS